MSKAEEIWQIVTQTISDRHSVRQFTDQAVPEKDLEEILVKASRAPSGGNLQPWTVHVISGEAKVQLENHLRQAFQNRKTEDQYPYYPSTLPTRYVKRKKRAGEQLYEALDIAKRDVKAMRRQKEENFSFFGAPAGLIFTIDKTLERGSWVDMGIFIGTVMVLAQAKGMATCPQGSFISLHNEIRKLLPIEDNQLIVCGMAIGYEDKEAPANSFRTERAPISSFTHFHRQARTGISEKIRMNGQQYISKPAYIFDGYPSSWEDFSQNIENCRSALDEQLKGKKRLALSVKDPRETIKGFLAGLGCGAEVQIHDPGWPDDLRTEIVKRVPADLYLSTLSSLNELGSSYSKVEQEDLFAPFYTGFTSGSTGRAKGFTRNQYSWLKSFECDTREFGLNDQDVIVAPGNFTHSLPLYAVIRALYEGATALFFSAFRPNRILAEMRKAKATVIYAVPTQLQALIDAAKELQPLTEVRLVLSSGAKFPDPLRSGLRTLFPNAEFAEFYGSSEQSYVAVARESEKPPSGSVGRAFGEVRISILDEAGKKQDTGKEGRIYVRSPYCFSGYADQAPLQTSSFGLHVGDVGYLDEKGFLFITGRADRMFLSSARNIHPEEIERVLTLHPEIEHAAVFGLKDEKRENRIVAVLKPLNSLSRKIVLEYCKENLAPYAIPSLLLMQNDWPLTPSGKSDLKDLEEQLNEDKLKVLS